jgi:folate-binding protein YgfZ
MPTAPYEKVDSDAGTLIRVADAYDAPRYLWIAASAQAIAAWTDLAQALAPVDAAAWRLADIYAGVPRIEQATQEQFVPQMVNFELIGGVNFKKGCYPGQEIVARSQYLGKLKRRMILATVAAADVAAGTELFSAADPDQPCGMVVNAERCSASECALLAEVKLAALETGAIHAGAPQGPALSRQALPYAWPDAA